MSANAVLVFQRRMKYGQGLQSVQGLGNEAANGKFVDNYN